MRAHRSLICFSLMALMALPALAATTDIGTLSSAIMDQNVTITGTVANLQPSTYDRQPNRLTVADSTGSVMVVIWPDVFSLLSPAPATGSQVTITGQVSEYRGELQVRVSEASQVEVLGAEAPALPAAAPEVPAGDITPLGQITEALQDQTVTVEGLVVNLRPSGNPRAPNTLTLEDDSGSAPLVVWPEVFDLLNPRPGMGNRIRAQGSVSVYRGTAQVRCRDAQQLVILSEDGESISQAPSAVNVVQAAAPAVAAAMTEPVEMAVSDIDGSTVGQTALLEGTIASIREAWSETAPNIITFTDGTSTIPLVMWSDDWNALPQTPQQGDHLRVRGTVTLYEQRNEIQIRVESMEWIEPEE
ncbi:exodeoxyribonuclease VII large subunit [Candidatus Sumerlaeota bacterium]|nr:exodeoxyribonuclease VII large subunit [Candidatus Sumerlaeota bacterium]